MIAIISSQVLVNKIIDKSKWSILRIWPSASPPKILKKKKKKKNSYYHFLILGPHCRHAEPLQELFATPCD